MKIVILGLLVVAVGHTSAAPTVEMLHLTPGARMIRADLYYANTVPNPKAVLVLSPGCNGSGEGLVRSSVWQEFAKQHDLGLVGLSFASPKEAIHDGTGYYYASKEAGTKLLEGIHQIYGKDLPLLLYGFSGGAHFTSAFEEWKPNRVVAWCAYSAEWWNTPQRNASNPAGIVACGENDPRLGASLIYFKQGRAAGKPWLWICIPETGHSASSQLDSFVRNYFSAILDVGEQRPTSVDIDQNKVATTEEVAKFPSLTGWLPSSKLFEAWSHFHEP